MYNYDRPSYTDLTYEIECYFPTWVIPENHDVTKALMETHKISMEKHGRLCRNSGNA